MFVSSIMLLPYRYKITKMNIVCSSVLERGMSSPRPDKSTVWLILLIALKGTVVFTNDLKKR